MLYFIKERESEKEQGLLKRVILRRNKRLKDEHWEECKMMMMV